MVWVGRRRLENELVTQVISLGLLRSLRLDGSITLLAGR